MLDPFEGLQPLLYEHDPAREEVLTLEEEKKNPAS